MKINEITEAPVNALKQKAQAFGARALNKIGAKSTAANLAGRADLSATANKLHQQFSSYMGTQGKSIKQATGNDLKAFLNSKNVAAKVPSGPINQARLDKMLLKIARDAMVGKTKKVPPAPSTSSSAPTTSAYAQTKNDALKLSAKEKRRLIQQLNKSLTKPASPPFKSRRGTPPTP